MTDDSKLIYWVECGRLSSFTKRVMWRSGQEARRFRRAHVGTEHILLAMAREQSGPDGIVERILDGFSPGLMRRAAKKIAPEGSELVDLSELYLDSRALTVIRNAVDEAVNRYAIYVMPEHLLLALAADKECAAMRVIESLSSSPDEIHEEIMCFLEPRSCKCRRKSRTPEELKKLEEDKAKSRKLLAGLRNYTLDDEWEHLRSVRHSDLLGKIVLSILRLFSYNPIARLTKSELTRESILNSMTREERLSPSIVDASRLERIADGSGNSTKQVGQFFESQKSLERMVKQACDELDLED